MKYINNPILSFFGVRFNSSRFKSIERLIQMIDKFKNELIVKEKSPVVPVVIIISFTISIILSTESISIFYSKFTNENVLFSLVVNGILSSFLDEFIFRFLFIGLLFWTFTRYWNAKKGNFHQDCSNALIRSLVGTNFPNLKGSKVYDRKTEIIFLLLSTLLYTIYISNSFNYEFLIALSTVLLGLILGVTYLRYGFFPTFFLQIFYRSTTVFYSYSPLQQYLVLLIAFSISVVTLYNFFLEYGIRNLQMKRYDHESIPIKRIKNFIHDYTFPGEVKRWRGYSRGFGRVFLLIFQGFLVPVAIFLIGIFNPQDIEPIYQLSELLAILGIQVSILLAFSVVQSTFIELFKEDKYPSFMQFHLLRTVYILDGFAFAIFSIMLIVFDLIFFQTGVFFKYPLTLIFVFMMIIFFFFTSYQLFSRFVNKEKRWNDFVDYSNGIIKSYIRESAYNAWANKLLQEKDLLGLFIPSENPDNKIFMLNSKKSGKLLLDYNLNGLMTLKDKDQNFKVFLKIGDIYNKSNPVAEFKTLDQTDLVKLENYFILGKQVDYENLLLDITQELLQDLYGSYNLSDMTKINRDNRFLSYIIRETLEKAQKCRLRISRTKFSITIRLGFNKITGNMEYSPIMLIRDYETHLASHCQFCIKHYSEELITIFLGQMYYLVTRISKRNLEEKEIQSFLHGFSLIVRDYIIIYTKILIDDKIISQEEGEWISSMVLKLTHSSLIHFFEHFYETFSYYRNEIYKVFEFLEPKNFDRKITAFSFDLFILETGKVFLGKKPKIQLIDKIIEELNPSSIIPQLKEYEIEGKNLNPDIYDILHLIKATVYLSKESDFVIKAYMIWGGKKGYLDETELKNVLKVTFSKVHPSSFKNINKKINEKTPNILEVEELKIHPDNLNRFISIHEEVFKELLDIHNEKLLKSDINPTIVAKIREDVINKLNEYYSAQNQEEVNGFDIIEVFQVHHVPIESMLHKISSKITIGQIPHAFFHFCNKKTYIYLKNNLSKNRPKKMNWKNLLELIDSNRVNFVLFNGKDLIMDKIKLGGNYKDRMTILNIKRKENEPVIGISQDSMPKLLELTVTHDKPKRIEQEVIVDIKIKSKFKIQQSLEIMLLENY